MAKQTRRGTARRSNDKRVRPAIRVALRVSERRGEAEPASRCCSSFRRCVARLSLHPPSLAIQCARCVQHCPWLVRSAAPLSGGSRPPLRGPAMVCTLPRWPSMDVRSRPLHPIPPCSRVGAHCGRGRGCCSLAAPRSLHTRCSADSSVRTPSSRLVFLFALSFPPSLPLLARRVIDHVLLLHCLHRSSSELRCSAPMRPAAWADWTAEEGAEARRFD